MFRTWFALHRRCAACGLSFERDEREDYWLGAFLLNFIVTETLFALLIVGVLVATWPDPAWALLGWGGAAQMVLTGPLARDRSGLPAAEPGRFRGPRDCRRRLKNSHALARGC